MWYLYMVGHYNLAKTHISTELSLTSICDRVGINGTKAERHNKYMESIGATHSPKILMPHPVIAFPALAS